MQITRLAGLDHIPGERTITKGGQFRYEPTPALAEWIRVKRRRPTKITRLESGAFILGCRAKTGPKQHNTAVILDEMRLFAKEIISRVDELRAKHLSVADQQSLHEMLGRCIMALIRSDESMRKGP